MFRFPHLKKSIEPPEKSIEEMTQEEREAEFAKQYALVKADPTPPRLISHFLEEWNNIDVLQIMASLKNTGFTTRGPSDNVEYPPSKCLKDIGNALNCGFAPENLPPLFLGAIKGATKAQLEKLSEQCKNSSNYPNIKQFISKHAKTPEEWPLQQEQVAAKCFAEFKYALKCYAETAEEKAMVEALCRDLLPNSEDTFLELIGVYDALMGVDGAFPLL
ncbi:MAG: hypothetical protein LN563_00690 [Rickettsia endosymbiont of Platyusa sonomae]|nr:hypothetical protein [Rickettsia endosymbiont of Platyusa sonomae]